MPAAATLSGLTPAGTPRATPPHPVVVVLQTLFLAAFVFGAGWIALETYWPGWRDTPEVSEPPAAKTAARRPNRARPAPPSAIVAGVPVPHGVLVLSVDEAAERVTALPVNRDGRTFDACEAGGSVRARPGRVPGGCDAGAVR